MRKLSIQTTMVAAIGIVVLLAQLASGFIQYQSKAAAAREEVRHINEAVVQPILDLTTRGVDGGNTMILSNTEAKALYKASRILYLKVSGTSAGMAKSEFMDAIPPQKIEFEYSSGKEEESRHKAAAASSKTGLLQNELLYVIKTPLSNVKNGGEIVAVFPADSLKGLEFEVAKSVGLLTLLTVAAGVIFAFFIGRRIAGSVTKVSEQIEHTAKTLNLTERVELSESDIALNREAGQTAAAFNHLMSVLQGAFSQVMAHTDNLARASTELSTSSDRAAASSESQSDDAAAMAVGVEQMAASLQLVSKNAEVANQMSRNTGELSADGSIIIKEAATEIGKIADSVRLATAIIQELGQQSNDISAIVQVIKDIADQTNLLALNAAIEAARAGEQGRGFAVVADEVRKLAERTSQSTTQISNMISAIQKSAGDAVAGMVNAEERVSAGVTLANKAESAITEIRQGADQSVRVVGEISSALREQNSTNQSISDHVEKIAYMTEENSTIAKQTAHAAKHLNDLSHSMRSAITQFKV
ncbi:MAG: methyl-accepting chemotaxis protein [Sulfurimicrobium sp.]|nr:methyl-accepting chemotaxis protein [Sulfurimicrobium sp.]